MGLAAVSEQVVVSAGFVPLTRSASGASLTVLDQAELRTRQLESSQDALRSVPGFTVSRSGGRGAVTSIFPRGGESDFTLIMVDGIRLNDMGGSYDAAHLPLFDLDRIEVVRGPQSAVYGSDAVGGVVQLVTRRGGPLRATGLFEGGTFGTWRANGAANGTSGRAALGRRGRAAHDRRLHGHRPGHGRDGQQRRLQPHRRHGQLGYLTDRWQLTGLIRGGQQRARRARTVRQRPERHLRRRRHGLAQRQRDARGRRIGGLALCARVPGARVVHVRRTATARS